MSDETRLSVDQEADVVAVRQKGRELAASVGISNSELTVVATAISEIARNIIAYTQKGEIVLKTVQQGKRRGLIVIAHDDGPGIADLNLAMRDGFSTGKTLGLGLPGARRLMDDFEIVSELGKGVTVQWRSGRDDHFGALVQRNNPLGCRKPGAWGGASIWRLTFCHTV